MLIDEQRIRALIPHAGAMCLLQAVEHWDDHGIRCTTRTHLHADNPLRREGALRAVAGIEYAAQAMALHGALTGAVDARPRSGYLVSLRQAACRAALLDAVAADLEVEAQRMLGDGSNVIYAFRVSAAGNELVSGRATVVLDVSDTASS